MVNNCQEAQDKGESQLWTGDVTLGTLTSFLSKQIHRLMVLRFSDV